MASTNYCRDQATEWMRYVARGAVVTWAVFWSFMVLIVGFAEGSVAAGAVAKLVLIVLVLWVTAAIPWRWEAAGGTLLIVEAMVMTHPLFCG